MAGEVAGEGVGGLGFTRNAVTRGQVRRREKGMCERGKEEARMKRTHTHTHTGMIARVCVCARVRTRV